MPALEPVANALARGPMPLSQCAKIVMRVCELLAPLHTAGRAHGAVTPQNVHFHQVGGELTVELAGRLAPGPEYTAPERVRGGDPSAEADVYTLGVLFFHMISGRPPFEGETDQVLNEHLHRAPPGLAQNDLQDIPEPLERLIRAMLSKTPSSRPTVADVGSTVENLDLDSTIMGVRLEGVREMAEEIRAEKQTMLLDNVPVKAEYDDQGRTDPAMVDPYADTFVKNRVELGLDEVEGDGDTALAIQVSGPISDDNTILIDRVDDGVEEPPQRPVEHRPAGSRALFGFMLTMVAIGAAVVTYLLLAR